MPTLGLFIPVATRKTFEDVAKQIVELIRTGRLSVGDSLPPERALAEKMDVSRATIRFAVGVLVDDGVLEVLPGRGGGIFVKSNWVSDSISEVAHERFHPAEVFDLLEARRQIEPRVAILAADRATRSDLQTMQAAIDLQAANLGNRARAVEAQARFHRAMWRAARNQILAKTMISIMDRLAVAMGMLDRSYSERTHSLGLHRDTLAAIRAGEERRIADVMSHHLSYLEAAFDEVIGHVESRPYR